MKFLICKAALTLHAVALLNTEKHLCLYFQTFIVTISNLKCSAHPLGESGDAIYYHKSNWLQILH